MQFFIPIVIFMPLHIRVNGDSLLIGGGEYADINNFPHSAALGIKCMTNNNIDYWRCGGSILNQRIILTVAHCLYGCLPGTYITVNVGNENKNKGFQTISTWFKSHSRYDPEHITNDIGLAFANLTLPFNEKVRRVAVMRNPPYNFGDYAVIAGWGLVDEEGEVSTDRIKFAAQKIVSRDECILYLHDLESGVICGISVSDYIAEGDSGSALIYDNYIQIGAASYKIPSVSTHLSVYTDVTYYYDWVIKTAMHLHCHKP